MDNPIIPIILCFVIILVVLILGRNSGNKASDKYDERQSLIRGRGYKISAMTMMLLGVIYFILCSVFELNIMEDGVSVFIIVCAGIAAFTVYAIFTDSFFGIEGRSSSLRSRKLYYIIIVIVIIIVNGIGAGRMISEHMLIQNGVLTRNCMSLVMAILFLLVLVSLLIRYFMDKREESGE